MKKSSKFLSYMLVALVSALVTAGLLLTFNHEKPGKLAQMEALIQERFIGEKDRTAMEDAAARAMIESLGDQWSYYIPAGEYGAYQERMANAYVGIGVTIVVREDGAGFDVTRVTPGGPAERAGLLPGDIVSAIEGQDAGPLGAAGARELIQGDAGSTVCLTIERDGVIQEVTVTREKIQSPVAKGTLLEDNIGLVRIENFDSRCAQETLAAIQSLLNQGAEALIFDVRFNPGGYKDEMVEVLDYLLPEGPLFRSVDYAGHETVDTSDENCLDIPMAVLVNGSSYSAAELFAAALKEYDAAIVVGEQTCGKGYFQNVFPLSDGSAVGLSVGKYFTPKGVSLAGVGITPDVVAMVDEAVAVQIYTGSLDPAEDPQIQAAIFALKSAK